MELFIELETLKLVTSQTDRREQRTLTIKRGDALPLKVRFLESQTPTRLDATTVINFALKESGKYDDDPVVLEQSFTASTVEDPDSDPHYTASPGLNTTELNDLFLIDSDSSNDPESVSLMGELSWKASGESGPTSIKTFSVVVENDVYRGDEEVLPSIQGPVVDPAAFDDIEFDDSVSVAIESGYFSAGSWVLNFWNGTASPTPSAPYLQYSSTAGWIEWLRAIRDVINTGSVSEPSFALTGSVTAHPTIKAAIVDDNTEDIYLRLIAKTGGDSGNSISYALTSTDSQLSGNIYTTGSLSGGAAARNYESTDFVSTIEEQGLDTFQKKAAIDNLIEQGAIRVDSADLQISGSGAGLILTSSNQSRWRITVDNSGNLSTSSI
jgi:hypothetical protein